LRHESRAEAQDETRTLSNHQDHYIKVAGSQAWKKHTINIGTPLENAIKNAATMNVHLSKLSKVVEVD
jgi:hypothetical protein